MGLPILDGADVEKIIPNCKVMGEPFKGGQKVVFPCLFNEKKNALKFMLIESDLAQSEENEDTSSILDKVTAREIGRASCRERVS